MLTQLTFQNGTLPWVNAPGGAYQGTEDTVIISDQTSRNYGSQTTMTFRDRTTDNDGLIRFNMSLVAPSINSVSVTSATLTFTASANASSFNANPTYNRFELYFVGVNDLNWLEGTGNATTPAIGTGATYSHEVYNTAGWFGSTYSPVQVGTKVSELTLTSPHNTGSTATFTLTTGFSTINSWLTGGVNGGFVILGYGGDRGSDSPFWFVYASETGTVANRPVLTLNGTFDVDVVPEPYTLTTLGLGLGWMALLRRRIARAV